ncbi:MAG TPA: biopolymer transporter Tol, partial [Isosphaeraceae bacterium]
MKHAFPIALALLMAGPAFGREARLVRYPHYHASKVTFSYLGDIWVAGEDGSGVQRLSVHRGRDYNSRFSPDGKWIAFSSDRNGNLDVFVIPAAGGHVRQLTTHSADDVTLNWTPDSKGVLFASQRGEDFMGKLYVVPVDGGMPRDAGPDFGIAGSFSADGKKLAINRKGQSYWRKFYRGAYQTDVTVMDVATKTFTDLTDFAGLDSWPMYGHDGFVYFVSDRDGNGLTNLWRVPD